MSLPLASTLKQIFPQSRVTLLCHEVNQSLVSYCPSIDEVLTINPEDLSEKLKRKELIKTFKQKKFDCVIVPAPDKFYHMFSFLIGAKWRIGFDRKWSIFLNYKIKDVKGQAVEHEIDYNLELLDCFNKQSWDREIDLGFASHLRRDAIISKFKLSSDLKKIALHVTTSNPEKEWPIENFKELTRAFLEEGCQVVLVGGDELASNDTFYEYENHPQFLNCIKKMSLDELGVVLNEVDLLISLDSGPYHLAWMQKTPVVGIFLKNAKGSNPVRWGVYENYVACHEFYEDKDGLNVEDVLKAGLDLLKSQK